MEKITVQETKNSEVLFEFREVCEQNVNVTSESPFLMPLTSSDILELFVSGVRNLFVRVPGVLIKENGFLKLGDTKGVRVTLKDEMKLLSSINQGEIIVVEGVLKCDTRPIGGIYPYIDVRRVENFNGKEAENIKEEAISSELKEILSKVEHHGFYPYIEKLVTDRFTEFERTGKFKKIKVLVIHGKDAQTHKDFEYGLKRGSEDLFEKVFELKFFETTLSSDEKLSFVIKNEGKKADLVYIVRGGGDKKELERIGGIETCKAIVESRVPVYCALGHSLDRGVSLLEKACQHAFLTPSHAGVELGKTVKLIYETLVARRVLQDIHPDRVKLLEDRIKELEKENQTLKKNERTYKVILSMIILFVLFIIFVIFAR